MEDRVDHGAAVPSATNGRIPTAREESVALARITAPLAAAFIAEMAMSVTDTIIVGHLGRDQLAAVGLTAVIVFSGLIVCVHMLSIVGVQAAHAHGAKDDARVARAVRMGFWVATLLSLPAMLLCWYIAPVLRLFGQDEAVIIHAEDYGRAVMWCFPTYLWFSVLRNFVSALSRATSIMVITVASVFLNLAANYALVFGKFGFPALGVAGAGYGTSLVCAVMVLALVVHVMREPTLRAYRVFAELDRFDGPVLREILRLGWSAGAISAVESTLFSGISVLLGVIGTTELAAGQIAYNCITVPFMVVAALSTAASVRVAHGMGVGSAAAARQAGRLSIGFGICYMALIALVFWLMPEQLAALFLAADDPYAAEVSATAAAFLSVAAVFQIFDGTQVITVGALRGVKDTTSPFAIGLLGYWAIGLGGGYLLAFELGHGGVGLWWGLALGLAASASLLVLRFHLRTSALMRAEAVAA
jgi:MATE family multidrug resistance protein